MKCFYHPDREAVAVCSRCRKPLCKECAKEYKGKIYCEECLREVKKEEALAEKPKKVEKEEIRNPGKIILVAILVSLGITLLLILVFLSVSHITTIYPKSYINVASIPYNGEHVLHVQAGVKNVSIEITKGGEGSGLYKINSVNVRPIIHYNSTSFTLEIKTSGFDMSNHKNRVIKVYVSPSVSDITFSVQNKVGNVKINNVSSSYADISVGIGDTNLSNNVFYKLKVSNGTGDISIENCTLKEDGCSIVTGTGNVKFQNITATKKIDVKLGTGNFSLSSAEYLESLSVKQGVGDCEIDLSKANPYLKRDQNLSITAGIGNITVEASNLPLQANIKALSIKPEGNFTINGDEYIAGDLSSPHFVHISIVSGGSVKLIRR